MTEIANVLAVATVLLAYRLISTFYGQRGEGLIYRREKNTYICRNLSQKCKGLMHEGGVIGFYSICRLFIAFMHELLLHICQFHVTS